MKIDEILKTKDSKKRKTGLKKKEKKTLKDVKEAVNRVPHTKEDFAGLTNLFKQPLPVSTAIESLTGVLEDDGLYDEINSLDESADAREVVSNWLHLNMPDKMAKLKQENMMADGEGIYSPLHGYTDDNSANQL